MLVVLEAAGLLVDRVAADWRLAPTGPQRHAAKGRAAQRYVDQGQVRKRHVAESRPARSRWPLWAALRHGVARAVARAVAEWRHARERRKLIRVLSAKDDRLLADIGISRGQIREVADGAVRHGPQHPSCLASPTSSSAARIDHDAVAQEAAANDDRPRVAA